MCQPCNQEKTEHTRWWQDVWKLHSDPSGPLEKYRFLCWVVYVTTDCCCCPFSYDGWKCPMYFFFFERSAVVANYLPIEQIYSTMEVMLDSRLLCLEIKCIQPFKNVYSHSLISWIGFLRNSTIGLLLLIVAVILGWVRQLLEPQECIFEFVLLSCDYLPSFFCKLCLISSSGFCRSSR